MPGSKTLMLTGQLGEVVKESAPAALSWLRAASKDDFFAESDWPSHVPSGSVPNDGPPAGVAIVAALHSLVRDVPSPRGVAMAGEITLRGRVLPVGGIKGKVLDAQRAGVRTVILPERNRKDVPRELRSRHRGPVRAQRRGNAASGLLIMGDLWPIVVNNPRGWTSRKRRWSCSRAGGGSASSP